MKRLETLEEFVTEAKSLDWVDVDPKKIAKEIVKVFGNNGTLATEKGKTGISLEQWVDNYKVEKLGKAENQMCHVDWEWTDKVWDEIEKLLPKNRVSGDELGEIFMRHID